MRCLSSNAGISHMGETQLLEDIFDPLTLFRIRDVFWQA
jgi:hypothetical protein